MLGLGLVQIPPVPERDPADAVLANPEVAERKRYCSSCGKPVGRTRDDQPGRTEGFCRSCGTRFSFSPKLQAGELVAGQYEVLGCLAHGGLGWIYLARDRNVDQRWVVLKGLLNTGDAEAMAAADTERAFLAKVSHGNIVKIYNFVQHPDAGTGALVGYIVMEYIGGRSLKDMLEDVRRDSDGADSLSLSQVIAYGLELLRALDYLHGLDALYCDLKPDNAIQTGSELKLIDLGAVYWMGGADTSFYGTVGYQAPEIADTGPTIPTDLYTVGRTLAVLSFPFKEFTSTYATSLPNRADVPLLVRYESFDRLLRRATHPDPARRFADASEMSDQLVGVLREVLAADDGQPRPATSNLFGPEQYAAGTRRTTSDEHDAVFTPPPPVVAATALPVPLVDGADPAAGFLAGLVARDPAELVAALHAPPVSSVEVSFRLARVHIDLGELDLATRVLDGVAITATEPADWRVVWFRGMTALAGGRFPDAGRLFDEVYGRMPGETAPKLALAFCLEHDGRSADAARYYETVWQTDNTYVSAAFGLARVRLAFGDRAGAVAALDSVPPTSSHYVAAQAAAVTAVVRGRDPRELVEPELTGAGQRLAQLGLDGVRRERLIAEVMETALAWVGACPPGVRPSGRVLDIPLAERGLRRGLERSYRTLARLTDDPDGRFTLVNRANAVRPRTYL